MSVLLNKLVNGGPKFALEQSIRFAAERHKLIAENVANISTPGYKQKDLDVAAFQARLSDRVAQRRSGHATHKSAVPEATEASDNLVFHDGNNRSVEHLMTDQAKNALMHNLMVELLRRQHDQMKTALRERVS